MCSMTNTQTHKLVRQIAEKDILSTYDVFVFLGVGRETGFGEPENKSDPNSKEESL